MNKTTQPQGAAFNKSAVFFAVPVVFIGVIVLIGWAVGKVFPIPFFSNDAPMPPAAAAGFVVVGLGLLASFTATPSRTFRFFALFALFAIWTTIGIAATLLVTNHTGNPNVNKENNTVTAVLFLAVGFTMLFLRSRKKRIRDAGILLCTSSFVFNTIILLEKDFETPLFTHGHLPAPTWVCALAFLLVSISLLLHAARNITFVHDIISHPTKGKLFIAIFPIIVAFTVLEGLLFVRVLPAINMNPAIGVFVIAIISVTLLGFIIPAITNKLDHSLDAETLNQQMSEEKFRNLFEYSPAGNSMTTMDGSRYTNKSFCHIIGYNAEELREKSWREFCHPDDIQNTEETFQTLIDGEADQLRFEKRFIHKNGSIVRADVSTFLQRNKKGEPEFFITTIFDITNQKKSADNQKRLIKKLQGNKNTLLSILEDQKEVEERLKLATSVAHIGIWDWDIVLNVLKWDDSMYQLYGIQHGDFDGSYDAWLQHIHIEDKTYFDEQVKAALQSEQEYALEFRIVWPDNSIHFIQTASKTFRDEAGVPVRMIGTNVDITARKQAELDLFTEKEHLAVTLRSIGDGVITTDISGNIVMLNRSAEEMTGWKLAEAIGRPLQKVFNIVNEHTLVPCENPVEKVLASGSSIELASFSCLVSQSGKKTVIADSGAPIRDSDGNILGVVIVFRDMTEKQKLNASMQRTQKLESLGILAGGIAHDFNNLLAGIFGYLEMANDCVIEGESKQASNYLNKATDVFDRALALTRQLLTFSKGGAPNRQSMRLGSHIQKMAMFALSGSNIACSFELAEHLWLCDCDENQIGQVMDNIIINAKQAMPNGGKIVVKAENISIEKSDVEQSKRHGNFVKISIKDSGTGMTQQTIERIFDPFYSTKETGNGLGLATVYSIVQRHDGWIDVDSELGVGSTFHIYIPASLSGSISVQRDRQIPHKGIGTILIMDDEAFMLEIVADKLKKMGYSVAEAKDGNEVLRLFKQEQAQQPPYAACILDLTIPGGLGGKELAMELRKIQKDIVLIAASGYSEDPVMAHPEEYGFTSKIVKPFKEAELSDLLDMHLPKS